MADLGVWSGIDALRTTANDSQEAIATAVRLEAKANSLREQSPRNIDRAIGHAVGQLMADYEAGMLSPRDSLEAVLDINQYKPSNVFWSGPPDSPKILTAFDLLSKPGTPHIIPASISTPYTGIISSDRAVSVEVVKERRGMGELPDALISFGSREVSGSIDAPEIAAEETTKTVSLSEIGRSAVGKAAIQSYIDSLELQLHEYACGHGYSSNEGEVQTAFDVARLLANASGFRLDTKAVKAQLQIANSRRIQAKANRRDRLRFSPMPPDIRFR